MNNFVKNYSMRVLKFISLTLIILTSVQIYANSSTEVKYRIGDDIWQSVAKKLKFCYDKNLYHNDFYRILNASNAYELDEKIKKSLSDKDLTLFLVFRLADAQWNAAWFVDPEWAVRESLEKRLYFSNAEIEEIMPQYLRYRHITESETNAKYLKKDQETLNSWYTNGFPIFDDFGKGTKLTYPKVSIESDDIIDAICQSFSDNANIEINVELSIQRDGSVSDMKVSGPLKEIIEHAIVVDKPAYYQFEYLDSLVAVPSRIQIHIEEKSYGYGLVTGWFDVQYNSKKDTWKIKSCGFTQLDEDDIEIIKDYLTRLSPKSPLRIGKHRHEFGIATHVLNIGDREYELPPIAKIVR